MVVAEQPLKINDAGFAVGPSSPTGRRHGRPARSGKGVMTISDLPLDEDRLLELAARLKQWIGMGGTTKGGRIKIQGNHRDRIVQELEGMGYRVKLAGSRSTILTKRFSPTRPWITCDDGSAPTLPATAK